MTIFIQNNNLITGHQYFIKNNFTGNKKSFHMIVIKIPCHFELRVNIFDETLLLNVFQN